MKNGVASKACRTLYTAIDLIDIRSPEKGMLTVLHDCSPFLKRSATNPLPNTMECIL